MSKTCIYEPIKKCMNIISKIPTAAYKSKVIKLKLNEDPLHRRVYFLSFMNSLKIVLSSFSYIYTFLMDYTSIRGKEITYCAKKAT